MQEFIAIDFETANPQRVSACALGYTKVRNCEVIETNGYLIKPVGGENLGTLHIFTVYRIKQI